MKLTFETCTNPNCSVIVYDKTEVGGSGYLPESSTSTVKGRFKKSDTIAIGVVVNNKTTGPEAHTPTFSKGEDQVKLNVKFDGWFEVQYIVLPSKEWFEKEQAKEKGSALDLYDTVYFSDGFSIGKYHNGQVSGSDITEITEVNINGTTLSREKEDMVSICFLKRCYVSLCQQIWNDRGFSPCWSKTKISSELIFKRDVVWMTINTIKYMVEFNQLAEAQRLIENIGGCNGLCKEEFNRTADSPCGCS